MAATRAQSESLRFNRLEARRLGWAFAISLAAHLLGWDGYEAGKALHLWQRLNWPLWLQTVKTVAPHSLAQHVEAPLVFVDVSPQQATPEPPKQTRYYSDRNARAANPKVGVKSTQPKLQGQQKEVPKTANVPRPNFDQLQPSPAPAATKPAPAQPRPQLALGDLTLARPDELQPKARAERRPHTLREARARQPQNRANQIPGMAMQQPGGVKRFALQPSFDVKATPFGAYDRAFIEAVSAHWYSLLDSQQFALDRSGKVVLKFHLNYDGSISDMKTEKNTVGELLGYVCQKAVEDPAPYARWPRDMRLMVGKDYRNITFTFYYY